MHAPLWTYHADVLCEYDLPHPTGQYVLPSPPELVGLLVLGFELFGIELFLVELFLVEIFLVELFLAFFGGNSPGSSACPSASSSAH